MLPGIGDVYHDFFDLALNNQNSFFEVFRDIAYKIGSFRLPTHRRNLFNDNFLI